MDLPTLKAEAEALVERLEASEIGELSEHERKILVYALRHLLGSQGGAEEALGELIDVRID